MPAVALAAVPGRRRRTLELAREIERRGFAGIYCASFGDGLGLCEALALATERIPLGTAIANLYVRHPTDYAQTASLVHELSGGRFRFGIGVSHDAMNRRLGLGTGRPLADARDFVERFRATPRVGDLPPVVLAGLRPRMVALAGEIADGVVFANVARSHLPASLGALPAVKRVEPTFFVGNMIPTCISEDRAAAAAVNRRTLAGYLLLPNYRNAWRDAGRRGDGRRRRRRSGRTGRVGEIAGDRRLPTARFGSAAEVRTASWPGARPACGRPSRCRPPPRATSSRRSRTLAPRRLTRSAGALPAVSVEARCADRRWQSTSTAPSAARIASAERPEPATLFHGRALSVENRAPG
jgi:alkanesulfonate monooxygenase SsuD/methylene tetrahydromethanopterin reductase-like flavin-dependent oxidoreductase (luciferase family)